MKVIAVLEDDAAIGGGFQQSLNAIAQMQRLCGGRYGFAVVATSAQAADQLRALSIDASVVRVSFVDKLLLQLSRFPWWHQLQGRLRRVSPFEKALLRLGCDLAYFVKQTELSGILQHVNFITTLFDLCHRDTPEFPEVREFGQFRAREHYFATQLSGALLVLTDSAELADAAARRYGLDRVRLLPMPFAPGAALAAAGARDAAEVLRRHGLESGYFFYPAQFWAHKNHVRILEALVLLRERGRRPTVAFAGGDKGNRGHVEAFADRHGLRAQVRFLGFAPAEDMRGLYEGCAAVLMPTYFGPTNLPPLEAWAMERPLIYSSRCAAHAGDAALCVDADDAAALAAAMEETMRPEAAARLVERGRQRLAGIARERAAAENELAACLARFELRRRCWQ